MSRGDEIVMKKSDGVMNRSDEIVMEKSDKDHVMREGDEKAMTG